MGQDIGASQQGGKDIGASQLGETPLEIYEYDTEAPDPE